jgi:hypothetical protein
MKLRKDEILDALADRGNVAQFVAFRPDANGRPAQSFCRLSNLVANTKFASPADAVASLIARAPEGRVNVRSFIPESPRSCEFLYALCSLDEVLGSLERLSAQGLHTIVNETVDISDGGVSGVTQGDLVEFAPDDTPRCVEKPETASLPFDVAIQLLKAVYGFEPDISQSDARVEFSIHPRRRGTRSEHTLIWEYEEAMPLVPPAAMAWPNRFSRHIGDKAYGLLIAWLLGQRVPATTVVGRRVAPFQFGDDTGSSEVWTRTCPVEPVPGLFTTAQGWVDPFALLQKEDPDGTCIASVLSQRSVPSRFAGAAINGPIELIIEGVEGFGDMFMLGVVPPQQLPEIIIADIRHANLVLTAKLGPVRFEWVHDGDRLWIVQLHRGGTGSAGLVVVPGDAVSWIAFDVSQGLEALRKLTTIVPSGHGIELIGDVGLTSHIADVVRRAGTPTRLNTKEKS